MTNQIFIHNDSECPWEYETGEEGRDDVIRWRTLLSSDTTPSQGISMGILEIPPGASLNTHYHSPLEVYYLTEGEGQLLCGDKIKNIRAGDVVYIPGKESHGVKNISSQRLELVWIFPCDTWYEIKYHYDVQKTRQ